MTYSIYCKFGCDKRFKKVFETQDPKRADLVANNEMKHAVVKSIKVICNDGYTIESLIYK